MFLFLPATFPLFIAVGIDCSDTVVHVNTYTHSHIHCKSDMQAVTFAQTLHSNSNGNKKYKATSASSASQRVFNKTPIRQPPLRKIKEVAPEMDLNESR